VYALCAQAAQTIHGIVAAGFHAIFPHLSSRLESEPLSKLRHIVWIAFKTNLALALLLGLPAIVFSHPILTLWMGPDFARQAWPILSILSGAFALFALNVTAHYAMLAIGQVRLVTVLNLLAGAAMFLLMLFLTPKFGAIGTASARLVCGPITCLLYLRLYKMTRRAPAPVVEPPVLAAWENS
jgi:O-antigen/teichoic acid export membrane protein